jgi:hypothetical protein
MSACGVAVDDSYVYWANRGDQTIGRARLDGSEVEQSFIAVPAPPCGVAVDGSHLFWASPEGGSIGRAGIDGSAPQPDFITGVGYACGVAVDDAHVYWAHEWIDDESIGRARLDGGGVEPAFIADVGGRCSVAVDSRVFAPPPRPSHPVQFGRLKRDRRGSAITLPVWVTGPGELTVASKSLRWRLIQDAEPASAGGHRWKLRLWPGRGPAAKDVRRQLAKSGRAAVNIRVTFVEKGMLPETTVTAVSFKRPSRITNAR